MTSAWELSYSRRSRFSRIDPDVGFYRTSPHNHGYRGHRIDLHGHPLPVHRRVSDGCDPVRSTPHEIHHAERALVRREQSTSQFTSSNNVNTVNLSSTSRPRLTENDRLPGAVLLARARLLQRLRGDTLSGNRGSSRPSPDYTEFMLEDDMRGLVDFRDRQTRISTGQSAGSSTATDLTSQIERLQLLQEPTKKPPGLTQEALDCLHVEVFSSTVEGVVSRASRDCSICLETFSEGDKLVHLLCGHRFHSVCLDPWVRNCGDCPYCRTRIVVTGHIGTE
ncbi:E3 ubiquitin-protein ligase RLIM [Morella rubra]|uniref:E3 ubiquitin-protein ligase RLIM n=1 Tax=Morella rubra TaxID=262757 RepID=A0A6A1V6N0_9ROSI|nr:E3 ubiquitin-protein ligase RLIM [Morella rubra]